MSLSTLLAALAARTRTAAVFAGPEDGPCSPEICAHKAELWRLAAEGFAQAATLETESAQAAARYHDSARRARAMAVFWSRHADLRLEQEAAAFEPA